MAGMIRRLLRKLMMIPDICDRWFREWDGVD